MDGINELAKLFKERDNLNISGIQIGKIVNINPVTISLGPKILLDKDQLVFSSHMVNGYIRKFNIENIDGETDNVTVGDHGSHSHKITKLSGDIQFTDFLIEGDEVILMPTSDDQIYFVLDKAVHL